MERGDLPSNRVNRLHSTFRGLSQRSVIPSIFHTFLPAHVPQRFQAGQAEQNEYQHSKNNKELWKNWPFYQEHRWIFPYLIFFPSRDAIVHFNKLNSIRDRIVICSHLINISKLSKLIWCYNWTRQNLDKN